MLFHSIELALTTLMIPSFDNEALLRFASLISTPTTIVITTHHKPDGDALGSSLALARFLQKKGHVVTVVAPSEFPAFLNWMSGSEKVIDFLRNPAEAKKVFQSAELICCLDFNDPRRVEGLYETLINSKAVKMLLDHHLDPKPFCEFTFSFPQIASTCELVYELIAALEEKMLIDQSIAECLYAGIMTDTGSFRFSSVSADTHRVVAGLMDAGARNYFVHEMIYDTSSESRLRFIGHCLLNRMMVMNEFNTVYFWATIKDMEQFNHQSGDLEGIVNYGLSMPGIKMAVMFSERDGIVKMSFRSKGNFSVKQLAETHFEGGGHKNAAGGRSFLSLEKTIEKFIALLPDYKKELTS